MNKILPLKNENKPYLIGIICFEDPFCKPSSGGKRGNLTRIYSLLQIENIKLDIYVFDIATDVPTPIEEIKKIDPKIDNVYRFNTKTKIRDLFGRFPICNNRRYCKECIDEAKKHHYDFLIFEGEQIAKYRFKNVFSADKNIIYMHDIESLYRKEIAGAQKKPHIKFLENRESRKFKYIEKNIDKYFDDVWFVSKEECEVFPLKESKKQYIPFPALEVAEEVDYSKVNPNQLLYVGDMKLNNNLQSMKWFVDEVFVEVKKQNPSAELLIVGRMEDGDRPSFAKDGVSVLGYVDDIESLYQNSVAFICPVLFGAGVKVKTIDGMAKGIIVITNKKGMEGTEIVPNKDALVFEQKEEYVNAILNIMKTPQKYVEIAQNGLIYIKNNHTVAKQSEVIAERFSLLNK